MIFDIFILIQKAIYQQNSNTTRKVLQVFLNVEWANKKEKMIPHANYNMVWKYLKFENFIILIAIVQSILDNKSIQMYLISWTTLR